MDNKTIHIRLTKFILSHTRACLLAATAILGVLLLVVSTPRKTQKSYQENTYSISEPEEYRATLEEGLTKTISSISGAGKSNVLVTLEGSFETVYANNAKLNDTATEKQLATASNKTYGEEPIVIKKLSPKIKGVLIVCEGGNTAQVKSDIINAASTALNIPTSRIYVTGGTFTQ